MTRGVLGIRAHEFNPDLFRPSLDGEGFGPWLDRRSAIFVRDWLTLSRSDLVEVLAEIGAEISFEEAIGLRASRPPASVDPTADLAMVEGGE